MRGKLSLAVVALTLLLAFLLSGTTALAVDQLTIYCQRNSMNRTLLERAVKYHVYNSIPADQYSNVRVYVRARRELAQPTSYNHTIGDYLQNHGLTVAREDSQTLAFSLSGTWEATESDLCIFGYSVYITVRARRVDTGEYLRYTTTSRIDINEMINGRKRLH